MSTNDLKHSGLEVAGAVNEIFSVNYRLFVCLFVCILYKGVRRNLALFVVLKIKEICFYLGTPEPELKTIIKCLHREFCGNKMS